MTTLLTPISETNAGPLPANVDEDVEPDAQWKESLRARIEQTLQPMVDKARDDRDIQLREVQEGTVQWENVMKSYNYAMDRVRRLAQDQFTEELKIVRFERSLALGKEVEGEEFEEFKRRQQAIWDTIKKGGAERQQGAGAGGRDSSVSNPSSIQENGVPIVAAPTRANVASSSSLPKTNGEQDVREGPSMPHRDSRPVARAPPGSDPRPRDRTQSGGSDQILGTPGSYGARPTRSRGNSSVFMDFDPTTSASPSPYDQGSVGRASGSSLSRTRPQGIWLPPAPSKDDPPPIPSSRTYAHATTPSIPPVSPNVREGTVNDNGRTLSRAGSVRLRERPSPNADFDSNAGPRDRYGLPTDDRGPSRKGKEPERPDRPRQPSFTQQTSVHDIYARRSDSRTPARAPLASQLFEEPQFPQQQFSPQQFPQVSPLNSRFRMPAPDDTEGIPIRGNRRSNTSDQGSPENMRYGPQNPASARPIPPSRRSLPGDIDAWPVLPSPSPHPMYGPQSPPPVPAASSSRPIPRPSSTDDDPRRHSPSGAWHGSQSPSNALPFTGYDFPFSPSPRPRYSASPAPSVGGRRNSNGSRSVRSRASRQEFWGPSDVTQRPLATFEEQSVASNSDSEEDYGVDLDDLWHMRERAELRERHELTWKLVRDEQRRQERQEIMRKAEEARRLEEEARRKEEEARKKEEDARRREEDAKKKADEARRKEEEVRLKALEIQQKSEELMRREAELMRREVEAKLQEERRKREEAEARLQQWQEAEERRKQEEAERQERERREKEERERREKAEREEREMREREERERREREEKERRQKEEKERREREKRDKAERDKREREERERRDREERERREKEKREREEKERLEREEKAKREKEEKERREKEEAQRRREREAWQKQQREQEERFAREREAWEESRRREAEATAAAATQARLESERLQAERLAALEAQRQREEARRQRELEAQRQRDEAERREAAAQRQRELEEQQRLALEEQQRLALEEQQRQELEEQQRRELEEQQRRELEERRRRELEEQRRRELEEQQRREAEAEAKRQEAEEQRRRAAEEQRLREAEEQRLREAEEQRQREAEEQRQRELEAQRQKEEEARTREEEEARRREEARRKQEKEERLERERERARARQREEEARKQREVEEAQQREAEAARIRAAEAERAQAVAAQSQAQSQPVDDIAEFQDPIFIREQEAELARIQGQRDREREARELAAKQREEEEARKREALKKREEEEIRKRAAFVREQDEAYRRAQAENEGRAREIEARKRAEDAFRRKEEQRRQQSDAVLQEALRRSEEEYRMQEERRRRQDSVGSASDSSSSRPGPFFSSTSSSAPRPIPKPTASSVPGDRSSSASSSSFSSSASFFSASSARSSSTGYTSSASRSSSTPTPTASATPTGMPGTPNARGWKSPISPATPQPTTATSTASSRPTAGAYQTAYSASSYTNTSQGASRPTPSYSANAPLDEEEWARRQQEQARRQFEQFQREQEAQQRRTEQKAMRQLSKEEVIKLFEEHERRWARFPSLDFLSWHSFPWPMLKQPNDPEQLTYIEIQAYVLSPHQPADKTPRERIKDYLRKWHPDRFETKLLPKVREDDREKVKEGAGAVARHLNKLLGSLSSSGENGLFG